MLPREAKGAPQAISGRADASARPSMRAIVLNGGGHVHPGLAGHLAALIPHASLVVAADSGADHALALGLRVDRIVGDLDSIDTGVLDALTRSGAVLDVHPAAKAATDLDLALATALDAGATHITVAGGAGDRFDHLLGAVQHLASPRYDDVEIDAWFGRAHVMIALPTRPVTIPGEPGEYVSLLAIGGNADGVTTQGLAWPLADALLECGSTLGVSNEIVDATAGVRIGSGRLLVVRPYALP
jgi:thiamine pyrophosphokinase